MEERTEIRCTKCNRVLTEPTNLHVYQCGDCGTILQGSEKSESDREIDVLKQKDEYSTGATSDPKVGDEEETVGEENMANGFDSMYKRKSKAPMEDESLAQRDHSLDMEFSVGTPKEFIDVEPQIEIADVYGKLDQISHWPDPRTDGMMRIQQFESRRGRFPSASYPDDEGPSNYQQSGHRYGYGKSISSDQISSRSSNYRYGGQIPVRGSNYPCDEHMGYPANISGVSERVQYLENDRAELLKQLQELQIKLETSGDVVPKPIDRKVPLNERMVTRNSYGACDPGLSVDPFGLVTSPSHPYFRGKHVRVSSVNSVMYRYEAELQTFYPPPNELPGYPDRIGSIYGRNMSHSPQRYPKRPSHDYFHGDFCPEAVSSYPDNTFFHQPACTCVHCYNKHLQVPLQVQPAGLRDRRFERPRGYYHGGANPHPLRPREQHPRAQMSVDLDSEFGSAVNRSVEREVEPQSIKRRCYPAAGGAPFITCHNCFELLKLPRKFLLMQMSERMLKCGACSTFIRVLVENKKLICIKENLSKANEGPAVVVRESNLHSHGHAKKDSTHSYSDDYGNYQSMHSDSILSSTDPSLKPSESEKIRDLPSSFTATSDGEVSPHNLIAQGEMLDLPRPITQPLQGSSLQELFEYSTYMRSVDKPGSGNKSKTLEDRVEMVPGLPTKPASLPNSMEAVTQATVLDDVSFNNTYTSQDSDAAKVDPPSFKSRDSSDSEYTVENDTPNVYINGHPLPYHLVMKAQKQAGRIYPGEYWYDLRAGFWGAMGQPCSGVIPPHIQEFNYPMPKDCSGGDTGVLVNGRELHQKDLNLLASRGLPTAREKSYTIEISGSVLDNDSREELDCLGRLAPTIQRLKRGFGMKVKPAAA